MTKAKHYTDLNIKIHKLKLLIRSCHCQRRLPANNRAGGVLAQSSLSVGLQCSSGQWGMQISVETQSLHMSSHLCRQLGVCAPKPSHQGCQTAGGVQNSDNWSSWNDQCCAFCTSSSGHSRTSLESLLGDFVSVCG